MATPDTNTMSVFWTSSVPSLLIIILFVLQEFSIPADFKDRSIVIYDEKKLKEEREAEIAKKKLTYDSGKPHDDTTGLPHDPEPDAKDLEKNDTNDVLFEDKHLIIFTKQHHQRHLDVSPPSSPSQSQSLPSSQSNSTFPEKISLTYDAPSKCSSSKAHRPLTNKELSRCILAILLYALQLCILYLECKATRPLYKKSNGGRTTSLVTALSTIILPSFQVLVSAVLIIVRFKSLAAVVSYGSKTSPSASSATPDIATAGTTSVTCPCTTTPPPSYNDLHIDIDIKSDTDATKDVPSVGAVDTQVKGDPKSQGKGNKEGQDEEEGGGGWIAAIAWLLGVTGFFWIVFCWCWIIGGSR